MPWEVRSSFCTNCCLHTAYCAGNTKRHAAIWALFSPAALPQKATGKRGWVGRQGAAARHRVVPNIRLSPGLRKAGRGRGQRRLGTQPPGGGRVASSSTTLPTGKRVGPRCGSCWRQYSQQASGRGFCRQPACKPLCVTHNPHTTHHCTALLGEGGGGGRGGHMRE